MPGNKQKKGEILIYGAIFESDYCRNSAIKINDKLAELSDVDIIDVRINSPGGSVYEGIAIYNSLRSHEAKINVYIEGMAASVAGLVAMAGDNIYIHKTAQMVVHNPSTFAWGDEHALAKEVENLKAIKESAMEAYLTKTNLSKKDLIEVMNKDTLYTAKNAVKDGFATHIIEEVVNPDTEMYKGRFKEMMFKEYNSIVSKTEMSNPPQVGGRKIEEEGDDDVMSLTMEKLEKENPELFDKVMQKGAEAERARMKSLDEIPTGNEKISELVMEAKYNTFGTKQDVALKIVEGNLTMGTGEIPAGKETDPHTIMKKKMEDGKNKLPGSVQEGEETEVEKQMSMGAAIGAIMSKGRGGK